MIAVYQTVKDVDVPQSFNFSQTGLNYGPWMSHTHLLQGKAFSGPVKNIGKLDIFSTYIIHMIPFLFWFSLLLLLIKITQNNHCRNCTCYCPGIKVGQWWLLRLLIKIIMIVINNSNSDLYLTPYSAFCIFSFYKLFFKIITNITPIL